MPSQLFDDLQRQLIDAGILRRDKSYGCSEEEISAVVQAAGRTLPGIYVEFLRHFGRCDNRLWMTDLRVFYPEMLSFRADVAAAMSSVPPEVLRLPEDSFVFVVRDQDGDLAFFCCIDGESDPPVEHNWPGKSAFERMSPSLFEFFQAEARLAITARQLERRRAATSPETLRG